MNETLILSQHKLKDFLSCQRRFQLRYLERLPWPVEPAFGRNQETRQLGQQFHQIFHRYFLGLSIAEDLAGDPLLRQWWQVFQNKGPEIPSGRLFPELSLTMPVGRHLLTGRFDLLVLGEERIQVFDWKTDARRPARVELQETLQTRIYLALAAEARPAMRQDGNPRPISLTYWYVNDPEEAIVFNYSQDQHNENWTYLQDIVADLDQMLTLGGEWPLTDDLDRCGRCAYQVFCGRIVDSLDLKDWGLESDEPSLEPANP